VHRIVVQLLVHGWNCNDSFEAVAKLPKRLGTSHCVAIGYPEPYNDVSLRIERLRLDDMNRDEIDAVALSQLRIMTTLPEDFLVKCTPTEREQVLAWWDSLSGNSQSDVRVLLDRRHDSLAYVYGRNDTGELAWHTIPFVDDELPIEDDTANENEWQLDYFQHLLDHPELSIENDVVVRTFHICTQHHSAILARKTGSLDQSFRCSDGNSNCPIARFVSTVESGKLIGYTTCGRRSVWLCKVRNHDEP
jgi:hypothetical protein